MMTAENNRVWIAWERQRRSLSLSARVRAGLFLCIDEDRGMLRYPLSIWKTWWELRRRRGGTVFVQNPSMVLAALACIGKKFFGYFLVVDRHSNFSFLASGPIGWKRGISDRLSGYTLRNADLTIVTNRELADRIEKDGARSFVLPDPFPVLPGLPAAGEAAASREAGASKEAGAEGSRPPEILFVSSWAFDEPITATMEACRKLEGRVVVRITGKPKPKYAADLAAAPKNFIPTGFVSDEAFFALMARSDAVMAVTHRQATLVCGAYEAAVLGKPMVLGDTPALREYFHLGAVYTDSTPRDLEAKIEALIADLPRFRKEVVQLREMRGAEWERRLQALESLLP